MSTPRLRNLIVGVWNVRGLGDDDKCTVVNSAVVDMSPAVLCMQETKLRAPTSFKLKTILPRSLSANECIDADGASGGILTAWDASNWQLLSRHAGQFCLTTELRSTSENLRFFITNVYAPCDAASRDEFFDELRSLGALCTGPWLIAGDFNIARWPDDRSGGAFDANLASSFNSVRMTCSYKNCRSWTADSLGRTCASSPHSFVLTEPLSILPGPRYYATRRSRPRPELPPIMCRSWSPPLRRSPSLLCFDMRKGGLWTLATNLLCNMSGVVAATSCLTLQRGLPVSSNG